MSDIKLPSIIHEWPTRRSIKKYGTFDYVWVALKIARRIYTRTRLAEAQNWRCCWCQCDCIAAPDSRNSATIEHVVPLSLGGTWDQDNLAMACSRCNNKRGVKSIDVMMGRARETKPKISRKHDRRALEKAAKFNENGWFYKNGDPLGKEWWLASIHVKSDTMAELRVIVFGEELCV
jgi:5-methylcytosine-specific restriction endonuclease McrA